MNSDLVCKCLDLNELIKNTDEYKALIEAEKIMEESEEVSLLAYKKDMVIVELEDAMKHYGKNSEESLKVEKKLAETTYLLNSHPLVIDYKNKLNTLNSLYKQIEKILFKGLKDEVC